MADDLFRCVPFPCHRSPFRWPASLALSLAWIKGGKVELLHGPDNIAGHKSRPGRDLRLRNPVVLMAQQCNLAD